jgi:hypothetical protein
MNIWVPFRRVCFVVVFLLVCGQKARSESAAAALGGTTFVVFDSLLYRGKPDLRELGMIPMIQVNAPNLGDQSIDQVDEALIIASLKHLDNYHGIYFLDYEQWTIYQAPPSLIATNIKKLIGAAEIARRALPAARFGYFGLLPCFDYWNLVKNDTGAIREWQRCNANLDPLAERVDVILPSLYTFYNDPHGWDVFAEAQLRAAHRYNKPVYAFLWPEFHVSNRFLKGRNLPATFWRHELEFCRTRADGVVIWGGWQKQWDDQAAWWLETKSFLYSLRAQ